MFELCDCGHTEGAHDGGEEGEGYECGLCHCQGYHRGQKPPVVMPGDG